MAPCLMSRHTTNCTVKTDHEKQLYNFNVDLVSNLKYMISKSSNRHSTGY